MGEGGAAIVATPKKKASYKDDLQHTHEELVVLDPTLFTVRWLIGANTTLTLALWAHAQIGEGRAMGAHIHRSIDGCLCTTIVHTGYSVVRLFGRSSRLQTARKRVPH